ncbi:hypothetical protein KKP04_13625 [Rhodomicrobium sp. Az07]|uniref:hypothetical protein n=1 Tax=Rhodomicrobium sp. Az07 TaxID=2839034 RepID=UPI001BE5E713|nr:hypothetical protein [Rhodomicrobium sp. Az07]MBT3071903.1 hypothetical protein [Rhodomicrobium sp. Az07]
MSIIKTKRNFVSAYPPEPQDLWVKTIIKSPEGYRTLLVQPIAKYEEAVAWAVSMADQFAHPIEILPIDFCDWVSSKWTKGVLDKLSLDKTQSFERMARDALLDSQDPIVRRNADKVLAVLGSRIQ